MSGDSDRSVNSTGDAVIAAALEWDEADEAVADIDARLADRRIAARFRRAETVLRVAVAAHREATEELKEER